MHILLDALRATALMAGAIVAVDAVRSLAGIVPMSAGTERQRDIKWLLVAVGSALLGGTLFFANRFGIERDDEIFRAFILAGWACLTAALVFRAAVRAASRRLMLAIHAAWFVVSAAVSAFL